MAGNRAAFGVVAAMSAWLGCNANIGLELPMHDLCVGVTCTAIVACHEAGVCDPATGQCSEPLAAPDGTACDDGSMCTSIDTCQGGVCNPGADHAWAHWVPDAPKLYVVTDDVVVDTSTGRTWQRAVPGDVYRRQEAQDYCAVLSLPGYPSGWRVPTRIELTSIVDYTKVDPAIDTGAFPNTPSQSFWSSSAFAGDPSYAWFVDFNTGDVHPDVDVDNARRVRCVR
jgi:hypothetical protein